VYLESDAGLVPLLALARLCDPSGPLIPDINLEPLQ